MGFNVRDDFILGLLFELLMIKSYKNKVFVCLDWRKFLISCSLFITTAIKELQQSILPNHHLETYLWFQKSLLRFQFDECAHSNRWQSVRKAGMSIKYVKCAQLLVMRNWHTVFLLYGMNLFEETYCTTFHFKMCWIPKLYKISNVSFKTEYFYKS